MINIRILTELGVYFKPGIHIQYKTECNVDAEIKSAALQCIGQVANAINEMDSHFTSSVNQTRDNNHKPVVILKILQMILLA